MILLGRWRIIASSRAVADELDHAQGGAWP